ncbi:hypothetical protein [Chroococcidiopsis sp [FACHB-1243]]|nr:hypothetical protein [Chroococcidiopsis sp. [FACHB-1243]]
MESALVLRSLKVMLNYIPSRDAKFRIFFIIFYDYAKARSLLSKV